MKLAAGRDMPPFEVMSASGETLRSKDYRGKRLWLILSRWAACPFCSLRLDRIGRSFDKVRRADVEMLVVFPSPLERIRTYAERYDPPFDVGCDPDKAIFRAFGTETSWAGEVKTLLGGRTIATFRQARMNPMAVDCAPHQMPADFLVDREGIIRRAYYGTELDDGLSVDDVVTWAAVAKT